MTPSLAERETSERTFERLYRLHRGDVYRFVLRDLRDPDDAEDVTQVAFLNAYRALQRGSDPEKPRAWLFTIAQNVARRRFRNRASRPREVELDPEALVAPEPEGPTAAEIRAALLRLRPNQRAVMVLREIGGLSYAEIAETLGLSVSAVETLLFRSRRALREELAAAEEQGAVRVGGIVLWPLPAALSEAAGSIAAWLGRRALAAKVAGAVGATAIGTGVAVQAGAVPLSGADREPQRTGPVPVTAVQRGEGASAPAAKAASGKAGPVREQAEAGPRRTSKQPASADLGGQAAALGELPAAILPQVQPPEASLPAVPVPSETDPPVTVPPVSLPPVSLPPVPVPPPVEAPDLPLPAPELPPLPDAGDLLP
jgi:RNA polymerase sigma-70 factor (ECF subfamily)